MAVSVNVTFLSHAMAMAMPGVVLWCIPWPLDYLISANELLHQSGIEDFRINWNALHHDIKHYCVVTIRSGS